MMHLPLGPLMIDIAGTELTDIDRERLCHPLVGGIILFSRNYSNPAQLTALTAAMHALRSPPLLIAVDHEGVGCSVSGMDLRVCHRWPLWESCGIANRMRHARPRDKLVTCWRPNFALVVLITVSHRCSILTTAHQE
jgi:hypothetical protein